MIARKCSRGNGIFLPILFFQVTVNNTNDGRASKHFEYDYAKECQTLEIFGLVRVGENYLVRMSHKLYSHKLMYS